MALTATFSIVPRCVSEYRVDISAVCEESDPVSTHSIALTNVTIETGAQKTAVINALWAKYQAKLGRATAVSTLCDQLELDAKANFEGR